MLYESSGMTVTSIVSQCQNNLRERIVNRIVASRMKRMSHFHVILHR